MSVDYYPSGMLGIHFAVCFSEKDYLRETKLLDVEDPPEFSTKGYSGRAIWLEDDRNASTILLCINEDDFNRKELAQFAGLVAHEAEHCTQYALKAMKEDAPGDETRAYMNGWFTHCAMTSWENRKKRRRGK